MILKRDATPLTVSSADIDPSARERDNSQRLKMKQERRSRRGRMQQISCHRNEKMKIPQHDVLNLKFEFFQISNLRGRVFRGLRTQRVKDKQIEVGV